MSHATRLAGACFLLFGLLTLAAPFLPSHADFTPASPGADIAAFFRDDLSLQSLQAWLHAGPALLLFAATALLFPRLWEAGRRGPALATTALVAAGALTAIIAAAFVVVMAAVRGANEGFDPHVALFLYNVGWNGLVFAPAFLAPFLIASVGLAARDAGLPAWLRPVSLAVGALGALVVLLAAVPATQGIVFAGIVLLTLWSVALGGTLLVRGGAEPEAARRPKESATSRVV